MKGLRVVGAIGLLLALAVPASADMPDSFSACAKKRPDGVCKEAIAVRAGATVYLKGKVDPPHADLRAAVWHLTPDLVAERLGTVAIGRHGCMQYTWESTTDDGSQTDPNYFKFKIKGHGESTDVEVMVFFGE